MGALPSIQRIEITKEAQNLRVTKHEAQLH